MAALVPVPNIGSQLERAIIAWLFECFGGAYDISDFYFSNDWKDRVPPLIDVMAVKSTEAVKHSRVESFLVRIEAKWPGANQPGQPNPDFNWKSINDFIGVVMAAMSQENDEDNFRASLYKIAQAGRRLAVFGTAAVAGATATDVSNNADMVAFYCDYLEFKGSIRAEVGGGELFNKEIRNFEVRACNLVDDSVFPALTFDAAHALNWVFDAGNFGEPAHWLVEKSVDGLAWVTQAVLAANARTEDIAGSGTQFWRVRRSEDGVTGLDPESNVVKAVVN